MKRGIEMSWVYDHWNRMALCDYCEDCYMCRDCIVKEWKEDPGGE